MYIVLVFVKERVRERTRERERGGKRERERENSQCKCMCLPPSLLDDGITTGTLFQTTSNVSKTYRNLTSWIYRSTHAQYGEQLVLSSSTEEDIVLQRCERMIV